MMLDATQEVCASTHRKRLFGWHAALFSTGYSGLRRIKTGAWRTGPIEVVSGPEGREKVHFEGPKSDAVASEMKAFLTWFEGTGTGTEPLLKAGLAHLYFVTIHPFEAEWKNCTCRSRKWRNSFREQRAAVLQHVLADPQRTQGLLRDP